MTQARLSFAPRTMNTALDKPLVAPPRRRVPVWWWFAVVLAAAIAAYSLRYVVLGERAYVPELAPSFRARPLAVLIHTLFGPLALLLGLVNLLPAMRQRGRWAAHRWVGRLYLVSALALAGLSLAFHAAGGSGVRAGFILLALATMGTVAQGYRHIRAHDVRQHREWMLRSYGLIFAAVTLRIWQPLLMVAYQGEFLPAYRWVAWVSWVPNALFVEWIIRRGWRPSYVLREGFASVSAGA
jgi:uncharacterized membrane protein